MKSNRLFLGLAVCFVSFGLCQIGCAPTDNIASGKAFMEAFPEEDVLMLNTADDGQMSQGLASMKQSLVGERANLHDLSFGVAFAINFHARNILDVLWFITRFPPTQAVEEEGVIGDPGEEFHYNARATWGPFGDGEGKDLEFLLHVWRGVDEEDGRSTYLYFVAGRSDGAGDDAWVPFLVGGAKPFEAGFEGRHGLVQLDFDAIRSFDPTEDDVGVVSFIYIQSLEGHLVAAVGEGLWGDDSQTYVTDSTYTYGRSVEGWTVLEFDADGNVDEEGGEALEHLHVSTAWYQGQGRSDAMVSGGDLGETSATNTQCWGVDLLQSYFHWVTQGVEPPVDFEDGPASACFLPNAVVIEDIDYEAIRTAFD